MTDKMPSDSTSALAKSLAKGSLDPKHGLGVAKTIAKTLQKS